MLVGPYGIGIVDNVPGVSIVNEIGLALLMFTIGLEFSMKKLKELSKSLIGLGLGMIGGVIGLTVAIGVGFDLWSLQKSVAIGMVLSLSSSAIVLKLLQSNRELETPFGNASVGILLAQDLSFVPMVLFLPILFGGSTVDGAEQVHWSMKTVQIFGGAGGLFLFTKYLMPFIVEKILKTRSNELFFFMLFFLVACIAAGAHFLIGSITLGAFLAGLVFASSPVAKQALSDVLPLRDVFLGVLFTSVGMLVDLKLFFDNLHILLIFSCLVLLFKSAIVYFLGRTQKYSRSVSIVSALVTFQVGEFSIVMIKEIKKMNFFTNSEVQMLFGLTVITMGFSPLIYALAPHIARTYNKVRLRRSPTLWSGEGDKSEKKNEDVNGHTIVVGFGVAGQALGKALHAIGVKYIAIEMNYDTVTEFKEKKIPIIFGDASRAEILHSAGIETAKMLIFTVPSLVAAKAVINQARDMRPDIEIVVRAQYKRGIDELKQFGEIDIVVAEYELTLELLSKALDSYGLRPSEVRDYLDETRRHLDDGLSSKLGTARNSIELPGWEASALIRPYKVSVGAYAAGKSLKDLHIRAQTGVSVATVYREGVGTTVPNADFKLESGDIIHLVGTKEAIVQADKYIKDGLDEADALPS
jgi:CPA2 family monovalent cation:H+ antiporter-2